MKFKNSINFIFRTFRGRLILGVALVHAVMMTLFIIDLGIRQRAILLDRQVEESTALAKSLSTSAAVWIASDDVSGLQELVESIHHYPELVFAIITDEHGRILAHTDPVKNGLYLLDLPEKKADVLLIKTPEIVDVIVPAQLGNRYVGWIRVGISNKTSEAKLSEMTIKGVLYAIIAILIGSIIAWFMGRTFTRRLYSVQNTIGEIKSGNRSVRSIINGSDEIASIASEFNNMLDTLDSQYTLLSALINSSGDIVIFSLDRNYCYTAFNEMHRIEMAKIWGVDIRIGMSLPGCMNAPELRELTKTSMDKALAGETFTEIQHLPGPDIYYELSWNPILQNKEVIGLTAFIRDITKRMQAEETLRKREADLKEAQRLGNTGSWEWNSITETINWSDEYYHIFGFDPTQKPPGFMEHLKVYTPESASRLEEAVKKNLETGEPYEIDLELALPDGQIRWITARSESKRNEKGEVVGLRGTAQDITIRKQTESQIYKLNRIYAVLSNINQAIVRIHNIQGILNESCRIAIENGQFRMAWIGLINPKTSNLDVVASAGMRGDYLEKINADLKHRDQRIGPAGIAVKTGKHKISNNIFNDEELILWHEDARTYGFKSIASLPLIVFSKIVGAFLIYSDEIDFFHEDEINLLDEMANDISFALEFMESEAMRKQTEENLRKAKEKAEESDRYKTAFLQNISHEIRTPMNAIIGFSGFLDNPRLSTEKRKSFTTIIQNSSHQLLSIVNDILTISALETKQENVNIQPVCINNILDELHEIFKTQAFNQHVSLNARKTLSNNQAEIYTDLTKVTQILTNLLSNALKFTQKGFIEFGYDLKTDREPVEVEFYVKDSGIGIKKEMQEKVFDRFCQADTNIQQVYGGTGLGLSISKGFVELLGGKIRVQSEYENGSTFFFTIPYNPVKEIAKKQEVAIPAKNIKTILIAEDDEYNYLLIEELLSDMDVKLFHANDGKESVEICKANATIDLILMDIKMPIMDGHTASRLIKEFRPQLPIIAQTAYALEHEIEKYKGFPFDDYITKPINRGVLMQILIKYFEK